MININCIVPLIIAMVIFMGHGSCKSMPPGNITEWVGVDNFGDEFNDAVVDGLKWHNINPKWRGRLPSRFFESNVSVHDGKLIIRGTRVEATERLYQEGVKYRTGTIKSRKSIKYGYFEISAKIAKSRISSAFWLYDHNSNVWAEIDIFELCGRPPCSLIYHTDAHVRPKNPISGVLEPQLDFPKKFQTKDLLLDYKVTAGLEWSQDFIKWYVNNKLIREIKNTYWHDPLFIVLDSEVFSDWFGEPLNEEFPSEFVVDYVRVWQRTN